jgi:hypothetical protein
MVSNPTTQDDWTVHALNIHGVFFERRCAEEVAAVAEWQIVSTNYPVEYPPPNGPWRGNESSLDIRARKQLPNDEILDVQIECKKANPEFVNWVFFPKRSNSTSMPFRTMASRNDMPESGAGQWTTTAFMQAGTAETLVSTDCREVRGDYLSQKGSNKTKTSNASIQEAAYQVALANRAVVHEDGMLLNRARGSAQHASPPWSKKTYIPLIVTTARLYKVSFSASDVALSTGEIPLAGVTLEPVQSALYEYPLPKHLQHTPADPLPALSGVEIESFTRMDIIVVQADHLADFIRTLR